MPVFGFNTDIKVAGVVFHIQTEDRGANNPVLDTTIYVKGRVLAKRINSYQDFLVSPDFNESELHAMLEQQHKEILEEVKLRTLPEVAGYMEEAATASRPPQGITLKVLNPSSFLKGATARLEVQTAIKGAATPVAGAAIRVAIHTGGAQAAAYEARTDAAGKAALEFQMPPLGPEGAEFVIQALSVEGRDEVKYTLRPRPKST